MIGWWHGLATMSSQNRGTKTINDIFETICLFLVNQTSIWAQYLRAKESEGAIESWVSLRVGRLSTSWNIVSRVLFHGLKFKYGRHPKQICQWFAAREATECVGCPELSGGKQRWLVPGSFREKSWYWCIEFIKKYIQLSKRRQIFQHLEYVSKETCYEVGSSTLLNCSQRAREITCSPRGLSFSKKHHNKLKIPHNIY